jgi:hypothetical protein
MPTKQQKLLIETSAVRPAIGFSSRNHITHFCAATSGGELFTSLYIRKEFIDRWIGDFANAAVTIEICDDVADALFKLEQQFSSRGVQGTLSVIAKIILDKEGMHNHPRAAEEVASAAVNLLKTFDRVFKITTNRCGCKIGSKKLTLDYRKIVEELHRFIEEFRVPVRDCPVNPFLQIHATRGPSHKILTNADASKTDAAISLAKIKETGKAVTCTECRTIGDVVIAADQPQMTMLIHTDKSFVTLCPALGKRHQIIKSPTAAQNDPGI